MVGQVHQPSGIVDGVWSNRLPVIHDHLDQRFLVFSDSQTIWFCGPVSDLPGWWALRSSITGQLLVPCAKTATRQRYAFSIAGPSAWKTASYLKIMKVRSVGCLRLICIVVAGLGASE